VPSGIHLCVWLGRGIKFIFPYGQLFVPAWFAGQPAHSSLTCNGIFVVASQACDCVCKCPWLLSSISLVFYTLPFSATKSFNTIHGICIFDVGRYNLSTNLSLFHFACFISSFLSLFLCLNNFPWVGVWIGGRALA
jgi:hypothetical protein